MFGWSISVDENDRLRDGERKDAGDSGDFLSPVDVRDCSGARRFSLDSELGRGGGRLELDEW
jgi:hypothetical protein